MESHPFVSRIAKAKLLRRSDPESYRELCATVLHDAKRSMAAIDDYPELIGKCYREDVCATWISCVRAFERNSDGSPASELTWLTLAGILRKVSHVGTANWQYVLPKKTKKNPLEPFVAFQEQIKVVYRDTLASQEIRGPRANFVQSDARDCDGVPARFANLVITSPPYPNNFDYADATRLEMTSWARSMDGATCRRVFDDTWSDPARNTSLSVPETSTKSLQARCSIRFARKSRPSARN